MTNLKQCIHDTTVVNLLHDIDTHQTGCTTSWNRLNKCLHNTAGCTTGRVNLYTGCEWLDVGLHYSNMLNSDHPLYNQLVQEISVVQPVVQRVLPCKWGFTLPHLT